MKIIYFDKMNNKKVLLIATVEDVYYINHL